MGSQIRLVLLSCFVVFFVSLLHVNAYKVIDHDLEVAASGKHEEWEKGDEADFHDQESEEKGHKGEKGYESKHGYCYFFNCFLCVVLVNRGRMKFGVFYSSVFAICVKKKIRDQQKNKMNSIVWNSQSDRMNNEKCRVQVICKRKCVQIKTVDVKYQINNQRSKIN